MPHRGRQNNFFVRFDCFLFLFSYLVLFYPTKLALTLPFVLYVCCERITGCLLGLQSPTVWLVVWRFLQQFFASWLQVFPFFFSLKKMKSLGAKDFAKLGREWCEGFIAVFCHKVWSFFFVYWDRFISYFCFYFDYPALVC